MKHQPEEMRSALKKGTVNLNDYGWERKVKNLQFSFKGALLSVIVWSWLAIGAYNLTKSSQVLVADVSKVEKKPKVKNRFEEIMADIRRKSKNEFSIEHCYYQNWSSHCVQVASFYYFPPEKKSGSYSYNNKSSPKFASLKLESNWEYGFKANFTGRVSW